VSAWDGPFGSGSSVIGIAEQAPMFTDDQCAMKLQLDRGFGDCRHGAQTFLCSNQRQHAKQESINYLQFQCFLSGPAPDSALMFEDYVFRDERFLDTGLDQRNVV